MNWAEFLSMGGYGVFVWGSYGMAVVVLVVNVILPLRRRKALLKMLRELPSSNGKPAS